MAIDAHWGYAEEQLETKARAAFQKGIDFFRQQVATEGGYVFRYASDLGLREGEEKTGPMTVWIQPPATPAVGMAYLEAYRRTGNRSLLSAAEATADCLIRGQLHSGGWANSIDFDPKDRKLSAYRVDGPPSTKARNVSTLDDNKSQSVMSFLANLDQELKFQDKRLHEASLYAFDALLKNQFPNGAWPQGFSEPPDPSKFPVASANYPETWSREFPKDDYKGFYTLNDNTLVDTLQLMLLGHRIYGEGKYRQSALKAGDFLLLAQMPEPQPAWAQQYNVAMQPAWARKFEPPAVSGGESQKIADTLLSLYQETGKAEYLESAKKAHRYLTSSVLPDGRLARFYELKTNRPLYFTREYVLTYEANDLPTHYGFIVSNGLAKLSEKIQKLSAMNDATRKEYAARQHASRKIDRPSEKDVLQVIAGLDERGAWVEKGKLSTHKSGNLPDKIIETKTFIRNLDILSRYLANKDGAK